MIWDTRERDRGRGREKGQPKWKDLIFEIRSSLKGAHSE